MMRSTRGKTAQQPEQQEAEPSTQEVQQPMDNVRTPQSPEIEPGMTYDDLALVTQIPVHQWRLLVDLDKWREDFIPYEASAKLLQTYFARTLIEAIWMKQKGDTLLDSYKSDFEGWNIDEFAKIDRTLQKEMIRILEQGGILVHEGRTLAEKLSSLTDQRERTRREPSIQIPPQTRFRSSPPVQPSVEEQPRYQPSYEPIQPEQVEDEVRYRGSSGVRQTQPGARITHEMYTYPAPLRATPERTQARANAAPTYNLPPARPVYSVHLDPQKLVSFQKAWRKDRNYTGKPYDILYDKVRMFVQTCKRLEISEEQYHAVFPDILEGRAESYFLYHIGPEKRWDEMYNLLDSHFNTDVNHSQYWADWTSITYDKVRRENPEKPPHEALDHLLDRLQIVQRALGEDFQGETALRTATARACSGVPELSSAFLSRKTTCEGFFADLHAALKIATDNAARTYYTDDPSRTYHLEQGMNDVAFVDRRYVANFK